MRIPATALSTILTALAALLIVAGGAFLYARDEVVEPERFADRVVSALRDDDVRSVASREIVANVLERGEADLASARPLLETAVSVAIEAPATGRVIRLAAADANRLLLSGEQDGFVLDLANGTSLIRPALESVAPSLAREIPDDLSPRLLQLSRDESAAEVIRITDRLRLLGIVLPIAGLLLLAAGIAIAPDRRAALVRTGIALGAACALLVVVLRIGQSDVLADVRGNDLVSQDEARAAARGVWDAFFGDLRTMTLVAGGLSFAIAGIVASRVAPGDVQRRLRLASRPLVAAPRSPAVRLLRALLVLAVGVALIVGVPGVVETLGLLAGAALLLLGADELAEAVAPRRRTVAPSQRIRGALLAALAAVLVVAAATTAVVLLTQETSGDRFGKALRAGGCNGSAALCDRRLNEVAFPGTHNSMSAANSPGWALANQTRTISRQLLDGIRLFLLDTHYGVAQPDGRVRTDLEAEGLGRNRLRDILTPVELRAAQQLAGPFGLGAQTGGTPVPYLCHTACELGATPLQSILRRFREFLEQRPGDVLVLMFEPSITPQDTERAFRQAGLLRYVAELDRGRPLPTLGQLIRAGRRLVVFTERDGGTPSWYHDAFAFIQDTPLGATRASQLTCAFSRGQPDSPIFMLNHWIDDIPPSVSRNAAINGADAIVVRAHECERTRELPVSFIAVDHYDRGADGGVVAAARRLNAERAAAAVAATGPSGATGPGGQTP